MNQLTTRRTYRWARWGRLLAYRVRDALTRGSAALPHRRAASAPVPPKRIGTHYPPIAGVPCLVLPMTRAHLVQMVPGARVVREHVRFDAPYAQRRWPHVLAPVVAHLHDHDLGPQSIVILPAEGAAELPGGGLGYRTPHAAIVCTRALAAPVVIGTVTAVPVVTPRTNYVFVGLGIAALVPTHTPTPPPQQVSGSVPDAWFLPPTPPTADPLLAALLAADSAAQAAAPPPSAWAPPDRSAPISADDVFDITKWDPIHQVHIEALRHSPKRDLLVVLARIVRDKGWDGPPILYAHQSRHAYASPQEMRDAVLSTPEVVALLTVVVGPEAHTGRISANAIGRFVFGTTPGSATTLITGAVNRYTSAGVLHPEMS